MGERFEAGQRWGDAFGRFILIGRSESHADVWYTSDDDGVHESLLGTMYRLRAPAPEPTQRWATEESHVLLRGTKSELSVLEDSQVGTMRRRFNGSAVDVAGWLLHHGYAPDAPAVEIREGLRIRNNLMRVNGAIRRHDGAWRTYYDDGTGSWPWKEADIADAIRCGDFDVIAERAANDPTERDADGRGSQLHHLRALGDAVAAIYAEPDRETSRRCVDMAVRQIRGEPFAGAIAAALVACAEHHSMSPAEIVAVVCALHHWETHRPFERDLRRLGRRNMDRARGGPWNRLQLDSGRILLAAAGVAHLDWDYDGAFFAYERARAAC